MFNFEAGEIFLVDKPLDWTSFDVVNKLKKTAQLKKVGHAGTLDPRATGLLIVCMGRKATKQIDSIQGQEKEYTGSFKLGVTTPSFDTETEEENPLSIDHLTEADIYAATQPFLGEIQQTVPIYSALKVNGKRMYELARAGKEVTPKVRTVHIKTFEITQIKLPEVHFRIVCGKGTYIRSIANDFGKALNVGGYLLTLRRTRIGDFDIDNAWDLVDLVEALKVNH